MKLPECIKLKSAKPPTAGWLVGVLLVFLFAIPSQAFAACSGAAGIFNDGTDLNGNGFEDYIQGDLPTQLGYTLIPAAGPGSDPIDVDRVRFGLTCADNGTSVPCTNGNDVLDGGAGTPMTFVSLDGGTCGASINAGLSSPGIVVFDLPDADLNQAGCTILVTTELQGIGTDASPTEITPAIKFEGICGLAEQGEAGGSDTIEILDPAIEVTKDGPATAKVGDEFDYTISFTVLSLPEILGDCTLTDPTLGINQLVVPDTDYDFPYTPQAGDPNPLENTATVTCDVVDAQATVVSSVDDDDSHIVDLINPAIEVTKSGPGVAKVGDEFDYTISFTVLSGADALGDCTLTDPTLGINQLVVPDTDYDFPYTPQAGDPNPLENTATVSCAIEGFTNTADDEDSASVDLINPAIEVTKSGPGVAKVGDEFDYTISFTVLSDAGALGDCTLTDPTLGIDQLVVPDTDYDFPYTPQAGDPNPLENTATVSCAIEGFTNTADDEDSASVDLVGPAIEVTKSGPEAAKVGDEFDYTISFTVLSDAGALGDCTLTDPTLGIDQLVVPDTDYDFPYTPQAGDPNPLENTATVSCAIEGFTNTADDEDSASVDLINPAIEVTKSGPEAAKVGDEFDYTISFTVLSDAGALGDCTLTDPTLGIDQLVVPDTDYDFPYTPQAGDPNPLENTATVSCAIEGFTNTADDEDSASVDLIDPSVDLSKVCRPDPVQVGGTISWEVTVTNDGNTELDCQVEDTTANISESVILGPGDSEVFPADREVVDGDGDVISNTATVDCDIVGFEGFTNQIDDEASADCEVERAAELCRTPGFWKNRAGEERGGLNITGTVIASGTPPGLEVCGEFIKLPVDAMEAMCVKIAGVTKRQLVRQLTAGALNCALGVCNSEHTTMLATCNTACETENTSQYNACIDEIDCFNNGGIWDGAMCVYGTGECAITGEDCSDIEPCPLVGDLPQRCVADPTCHDDGNLCEDGAEFCFEPPGNTSSVRACKRAQRNSTYFPYPSG